MLVSRNPFLLVQYITKIIKKLTNILNDIKLMYATGTMLL